MQRLQREQGRNGYNRYNGRNGYNRSNGHTGRNGRNRYTVTPTAATPTPTILYLPLARQDPVVTLAVRLSPISPCLLLVDLPTTSSSSRPLPALLLSATVGPLRPRLRGHLLAQDARQAVVEVGATQTVVAVCGDHLTRSGRVLAMWVSAT